MRGNRGDLDGEFLVTKNTPSFANIFSRDVLEVGVLEEGGVFEPVAEEAVEGDVGCPDEGDGCGEPPVLKVAEEEEG